MDECALSIYVQRNNIFKIVKKILVVLIELEILKFLKYYWKSLI